MGMIVWMVRVVEGGWLVDDFWEYGVVVIGWIDLGDLN